MEIDFQSEIKQLLPSDGKLNDECEEKSVASEKAGKEETDDDNSSVEIDMNREDSDDTDDNDDNDDNSDDDSAAGSQKPSVDIRPADEQGWVSIGDLISRGIALKPWYLWTCVPDA